MLDPLLQIENQSNTVSLVVALADYAATRAIRSDSALAAARHCLIAALARGFEALRDPECAALIGPLVPGALMPGGARVPGTSLELDPAQAAFCTGLMLCRPAAGGHGDARDNGRAADPIAAILAVADYQGRKAAMEGKPPPQVRDVLGAIVKVLEIQGVLADQACQQQTGTGTATLRVVRVATTAIVTAQLGGALGQIATALSYACIDGGVSMHAADEQYDGRREDWARADAVGRAVRHACQAIAASRSSYLTALDLAAVDLAGKLLGAKRSTPAKRFGTEGITRLADLHEPRHAAQLMLRFQAAVARSFPPRQAERIKTLFAAPDRLDDLPINELLAALVTNGSGK
jgi:2-methylcitrate dehydratase PrpD